MNTNLSNPNLKWDLIMTKVADMEAEWNELGSPRVEILYMGK